MQSSLESVEKRLKESGEKLPSRCRLPMTPSYSPELDATEEFSDDDANYYQSLIGILRWVIERCRMDIYTEVSMLSSYLSCPREGHFTALLQIFAYLQSHHNTRVVFDPSYRDIDEVFIEKKDWSDFYNVEEERIPDNAPRPLGKEFIVRAFVDASYAGCKLTRRSRTGFVVYLNSDPIYWYSKKQGS